MSTLAIQHQDTVTGNVMLPRAFEIKRTHVETHDTYTLDLVPADGSPFSFAPGQFNMLYAYGVGEVPISISGDSARSDTLTHTIRAVGTVTRAMQKLKASDTVGVRGPYGTAWPVELAEGYDAVIVTGGIGLAPLRPAIYHVLAHRAKYGKVVLLYGSRTPADILYRKELEQLRSRFDVEVLATVDRAGADWHGHVGVVTNLVPKATFDPANTIAMICGPEIMMRFAVVALQKRGVDLDQIYVSLERNMKCGVGFCGHCQYGPVFICKDGPVFRYDKIREFFSRREI